MTLEVKEGSRTAERLMQAEWPHRRLMHPQQASRSAAELSAAVSGRCDGPQQLCLITARGAELAPGSVFAM